LFVLILPLVDVHSLLQERCRETEETENRQMLFARSLACLPLAFYFIYFKKGDASL
jgi:hypothetical protein